MNQAKQRARLWVRQQIKTGRRAAWPMIGCGLLAIGCAVGQVWCIAQLLARLVQPQSAAGGAAGAPWALLASFGVLGLLRAVLGVVADRAAHAAGAASRRRLRSDVLGRLLAAGPALLHGQPSGVLTTLVVDRIEALDGLFGRWIPAATLALAGPVLVLLVALWAWPIAGLVLALAGLAVPFGMALAGIGAAVASQRQFTAMGRLQARFLDRIRGIATIVLAGQEEAEARALAAAAADLRRRTMRVLRVAFLSSAILDCAAAAALVALALLALRGPGFTATSLFALLLVPEFFAPLRAYSAAYQDRMQATGAGEALTALPVPPAEAAPAAVRNVSAHGVTIAFDNVRFSWDASRAPALNGLSFRVPAHEVLVLAGPSGAGKSTIMEILLGFVRPDAGQVSINGADIASIVPAALSRMIAWMGQRPMLFAGSIRDNIRFARPDASDADMQAAIRAARVEEFAATLPQGLDTVVGEGGFGLSGGQAQRVAIARAYLKNAPVLLLDEPTAHLDPATEADVLDSLRRLAVGRTVILASHAAAAHQFGGRRIDLRDGRAVPTRGVA